MLLSATVVVAVAQESGRYRKDVDHHEFNLAVDGQTATLTGWRYELSFSKRAEGRYVSESGAKLESIQKELIDGCK